jgi:hypothetical protein
MWPASSELSLLLILACAGCGEEPRDSADSADDAVLRLEGDGGGYALDGVLSGPSLEAALGVDVRIDFEGLEGDLFGLPLAEIEELAVWGFDGLEHDAIAAGLVAGSLVQSRLLTRYSCVPQERACRFSELEVYGHDYSLVDDFESLDATWLVTLHGADRRGLQGIGFLGPGEAEQVSLAEGSTLALSVDGGQAQEVSVGSSLSLDWSGLDRDAQGQPLAAYRLDLLALYHLDVAPDLLEARLEAQGLQGARAWWLDIDGRDEASLSELDGAQPFGGLEAQGSWLLALYSSHSLGPLPRLLLRLDPR